MLENMIACRKFEELTKEQAALTGSIIKNCADCDCKVWIVPRNLLLRAKILCKDCAKTFLLTSKEPVIVSPAKPTVDQLFKKNYPQG